MNLKGKRRTLFLLLAVVVLAGGDWLWQVLNAPAPQYQTDCSPRRTGAAKTQPVLATALDALAGVIAGASGQRSQLENAVGRDR